MRRAFGDPTAVWPRAARDRRNLVEAATDDPTLFPLAMETLRSCLMASGSRTAQRVIKTVQEDLRTVRQDLYRVERDLAMLDEVLAEVVELDKDPFDTTYTAPEWPPYVSPFEGEDA